MKSVTKYLVAALLLIAIAIGVVKLSKKPQWITPTELNLTIKTKVLAKVKDIPISTKDNKADTLHLLANPSHLLVVKVPKGSHPVALEVGSTKLPLRKIAPNTYQTPPVHIEGKRVEAKLIFPPKTIYKLPQKALHFKNEKAYVIAKEGNRTKQLPVTILKKSASYSLVIGNLQGVKVQLP